MAVTAGAAGLLEDAMRWAERAVADRDPPVLWSRRFPFWDPIRKHPRYAEVLRPVWG